MYVIGHLVLKITLKKHNYYHELNGRMYFSKYQKPFTLSFTRFTHFTLKIYAEFFTLFTRYCFTFYAFYQHPTAAIKTNNKGGAENNKDQLEIDNVLHITSCGYPQCF